MWSFLGDDQSSEQWLIIYYNVQLAGYQTGKIPSLKVIQTKQKKHQNKTDVLDIHKYENVKKLRDVDILK